MSRDRHILPALGPLRIGQIRVKDIEDGSATECAAILDIAGELDLPDEAQLGAGRQHLQTIVAVLIGLVKHIEAEDGQTHSSSA